MRRRRILQHTFIAHRYLYHHLKILHCDLSISNILLNRKDDSSEPTGLLIDYDFSVNTASEAVNHQDTAADDTPIVKRVAAASDAEAPSDAFEGRIAVGAGRTRRQTPRTPVRFYQLLETSTNLDLRAGYTAIYGH
jgi:serine/threonine protein kinase